MRSVWPEVDLMEPSGEPPEEDGATFADNALIKARAAYQATGLPSVADDSGICVDALGGEPGIHSARYSGTGDDQANLELLLANMSGATDRRARFVCAAAIVDERGEATIERDWPGQIGLEPAGEGGFGYDPIFIPDGSELSAAQLSPEHKNAQSHRGQAFVAMATLLRTRYER